MGFILKTIVFLLNLMDYMYVLMVTFVHHRPFASLGSANINAIILLKIALFRGFSTVFLHFQ